MKKSWKFIDKIFSGKKTIESRWYKSRRAPWNKIKKGEIIYFKDSGEPVTLKAEADKVLQFSGLTPEKTKQIINKYGKRIGVTDVSLFDSKKYCILVFLKNPKKVEPFKIKKKGFGLMSAWISVEHVEKIKRKL